MADPPGTGTTTTSSTASPYATTRPAASDANVLQPVGSAYVIPLSVRGAAGATAPLQQWTDASERTLASLSGDGTRIRLAAPTGDAAMRLQAWEQRSPDGGTDRILALTYNRAIRGLASTPDDPSQPTSTLQLESWWNSTAELNWDFTTPEGAGRRPLGLGAGYDGTVAGLALGTNLAPGAAGVEIWGGTRPDVRTLRVYERQGADAGDTLFAIFRPDRTASFAWRGGGVPRLVFAVDGVADALATAPTGVLTFAQPTGGPILSFEENGTGQQLLASYPLLGDSRPAVAVNGDGSHEWGRGAAAAADLNLYRATTSLLRSDYTFQAAGGLATRVLTRPPRDSDFPIAFDGLMVVDAAGTLYVRIANIWRSARAG